MSNPAREQTPPDGYNEFVDLILELSRELRAWRPTDPGYVVLTPTERAVMRLVDTHPGSSSSELADRSRLQRTNLSTTLGALEQKGLVRRVRHSGRSVTVEPTDLARSNLRLLQDAWSEQLRRLMPDVHAMAGLNSSLRRVATMLECGSTTSSTVQTGSPAMPGALTTTSSASDASTSDRAAQHARSLPRTGLSASDVQEGIDVH